MPKRPCFSVRVLARVTPQGLRYAVLLLLLPALPVWTGCTGAIVGAGAVAGTTAMQERGIRTAIDDTVIDARINKLYLEEGVPFRMVRIDVHEGRVLLTGTVPKPEDRVDAVRLAWQIDGVREVINELAISDSSGLTDMARDAWIATQLRVRITFDKTIRSINYTIDSVNGTVYLMGIARSPDELERVRSHARNLEHVRRIVSHVRVMEAGPV